MAKNQSGVFVLQNDNSLISMQPTQFASEAVFQELLARFPELLVGDQVDAQSPRRWMLVRREQTITTSEVDASQWSLDHLFLDQDGIPTLVELKRQTDSRIRREVVGQMLDYAANCAVYWSASMLQASLALTCQMAGRSSDEVLAELIGPDQAASDFWEKVKTNLQAGRIRLLFVADSIPVELRRVVEFLNRQMDPAEVLAIELRQFASHDGLRTIVPMVIGQTQEAASKKAVSASRQWGRDSFLEALGEAVPHDQRELAQDILKWMERGGRAVRYGVGQKGSAAPDLRAMGVDARPIYLTTDGRLYLQFPVWQGRPVFDDLGQREELVRRFGTVIGSHFDKDTALKYASLWLKDIVADPEGRAKIFDALAWMEDQLTAALKRP
jgi:hypothetical protein